MQDTSQTEEIQIHPFTSPWRGSQQVADKLRKFSLPPAKSALFAALACVSRRRFPPFCKPVRSEALTLLDQPGHKSISAPVFECENVAQAISHAAPEF